MLEVAGDLLAGLLDRLGERQAIGKAGQAVAQHLGTERALGLDLDGAIHDAQKATGGLPLLLRQWRELDPEVAPRNPFAVLEVELAGDVRAVEEILDQVGDGPSPQAL